MTVSRTEIGFAETLGDVVADAGAGTCASGSGASLDDDVGAAADALLAAAADIDARRVVGFSLALLLTATGGG